MAQDDAIDVARFVDEQKVGAFHVKLLILSFFLVLFPGIMIMINVLAFNLLGDGLRDALDPRLNK